MAMAGLVGTTAVTTHELEAEEMQVVEAEETSPPKAASRRKAENGQGMAQAEALSALGNLGYGPGEAVQAVAQAAESHPQAPTPELIRAAREGDIAAYLQAAHSLAGTAANVGLVALAEAARVAMDPAQPEPPAQLLPRLLEAGRDGLEALRAFAG